MILKGVAMYRGRVLSDFDHWGDDDVMLRAEFTQRNLASATTYLHVLSIGPETIEEIAHQYPLFYQKMRRWVLLRAIRRA